MQLFGHHISRHTIALAALEIILILCCLQMALMVAVTEPGQQVSLIAQNSLVAGLIVIIMETMGLYDREAHARLGIRGLDDMLRLAASLLLALAIIVIVGPWLTEQLPSNKTLLIGSGLAFLVVATERFAYRRISEKEAFAHRILVLGTGSRAMNVETCNAEAHRPYKVVSFVSVEDMEAVDVPAAQVMSLAPGQSLLKLARSLNVEEIVVAIRNRRGVMPIRQLLECKLQGITVTDISTFFEREHQRLELGSMNTSWLVFGSGFRQSWFGNLVKRIFDLLLSLVILLLTWPIMLITAIAIQMDTPGSILYWQTRVGRGNKEFQICKFRSMTQDAEKDGKPQWAASNDQRVTRVGRIIRKLRIDELPQIINVLKGEMSFIGPRPERPIFVEQLSKEIPYFLARHSIRPGISGWAQVRYPYGASVEDARQKLQYDLYYVKNHTLFLDILIMFETIKVVVFGRGAR